ncbi:MAG: FtsX-like permease family protein [Acetobacteraceae bacterium]|nr:FtsX-like permease family protein [Acetobacteraceae bacterium]
MTWPGLLLRNLVRRPGRSSFTLLGVALAIAGFLTLTGVSKGLRDASQASLRERGIDLVVMQRGMVEFFSSNLPEILADDIRRIPGVASVSGELGALLPFGEDNHALVGGWQLDNRPFEAIPLIRGRLPVAGEHGVILGQVLAEALHADIGTTVLLQFSPFKVVGIGGFTSPANSGMAVLRLAELQALLGRPGRVTLFQMQLTRPDNIAAREAVRAAVSALRPDLVVSVPDEVLKTNRSVAMLAASSAAISVAALVMAGLLILNTLVMAVEERTHEIGILAAIGWSRWRIVGLILGEGVILAAAGGLTGAIAGHLGGLALYRFVLLDSGIAITVQLAPAITAVVCAVGLGGLGAIYPAWKASRLSPTAALRQR